MKPRFQLLIEAQPQTDDADGTRRLRMALKRLLRSHGLRCLNMTPVDDAQNAGEATSNQTPTASGPEK